ncbi:hypothetical protein [Noviherbaspirillum agri]
MTPRASELPIEPPANIESVTDAPSPVPPSAPSPVIEVPTITSPASDPVSEATPDAAAERAAGGIASANKKSGKPAKLIVGSVALVIAVLGAGAAWWFNRTGDAPAAVVVAANPAPDAASAGAPPAPAVVPVAASVPPESAKTTAVPAEEPLHAGPESAKPAPPQPTAEEIEEKKAAQLAKRKAAEEARKKKLEEQKAKEEARARQVAAAAPQPKPEPAQAAAAPRSSGTAERLAQCQSGNVFKRELCIWQVCNNKWGQDGCPAYQSKDNQNNY